MSKADEQIKILVNGSDDTEAVSIQRQRRLTERSWSARHRALVGVITSLVLAGALVRADTDSDTQSAANGNHFPPRSEAERELEQVLQATDIDLALMNWLVAADLPEFRNLTRAAYFKQLDALTEQMHQSMEKMQKVAVARGENLQAANTRCAIFCNAVINLRFSYAEEFRQEKITPALLRALYADSNNISLAGLLRTRRGSCVSMPLIYLVIGQRLGMPVHLVTIGKHYFIRWEEPGYGMNIEPTIVERVSVSPDDTVYLETEGVTREQLRGSELRNLTHREVVGNLLFARSAYWATKGPEYADRQNHDLARARQLAPDDFGIKETYEAVMNRAGSKAGLQTGSAPASGAVFRAHAENPGASERIKHLGQPHAQEAGREARSATPGAGVLPKLGLGLNRN